MKVTLGKCLRRRGCRAKILPPVAPGRLHAGALNGATRSNTTPDATASVSDSGPAADSDWADRSPVIVAAVEALSARSCNRRR